MTKRNNAGSARRPETVQAFRERLSELVDASGVSRSAFAARAGLDRSTLTQLLSPANQRLPRAETILGIARGAQASIDWLLGLSQEGRPRSELVDGVLEIAPGSGLPMDERLQRWHAEAAGYKIRYVPTTLPDLLKTNAVIRHEYRDYDQRVPEARIEQAGERLAYSRRPETEMEVCCPVQTVDGLARGEGVWSTLPARLRRAQMEWMVELVEELYPTFRWFLYDGLRHFSVPLTIFGPRRVAVYFGGMYFVFNGTDQIRVLSRHFDDLIRAAVIQPPDVAGWLRELMRATARRRRGR